LAASNGRLNLKLAGEPLPADPAALADARAAIGERPVLLVASTHPGEEALPLDVFAFLKDRPERPLLVIVPRHPVRGAAIEAQARADGFATARRSARLAPSGAVEVYVADTLGELGLWFRLARLAVMGGSLVERIGGHNPLEPARLGCPVASGPHIDNWRGVYDDLQAERAVRRVEGPATLAAVMAEALADPTELRTEAVRAAAFAARQSGVVAAAATQLQALL
jgi:3-deoxy-D-manno-octulosonic-acid transferase